MKGHPPDMAQHSSASLFVVWSRIGGSVVLQDGKLYALPSRTRSSDPNPHHQSNPTNLSDAQKYPRPCGKQKDAPLVLLWCLPDLFFLSSRRTSQENQRNNEQSKVGPGSEKRANIQLQCPWTKPKPVRSHMSHVNMLHNHIGKHRAQISSPMASQVDINNHQIREVQGAG